MNRKEKDVIIRNVQRNFKASIQKYINIHKTIIELNEQKIYLEDFYYIKTVIMI